MNFVSKVDPYHLSEDVSMDRKIDIFFFLDLDQGTLTPDKILLINLNEEVSEEVRFEYRNRHLTIYPLKPLKPDMHYQVQIVGGRNGVKNIIGQEMAETYVSEFYTKKIKEIQPPILVYPIDLTEVTDDIEFEWKPVVDAKYYELEVSRSNTFHNLVWPLADTPIFETKIMPHINYEIGTYYVRIRSVNHDGKKSHYTKAVRYYYKGKTQTDNINTPSPEVKEDIVLETKGEVIGSGGIIHTLQKHFLTKQASSSHQPLKIVKSTPKHKGLHVDAGEIVIKFNKEIDPESVTEDSIYLIEERN